MPLLPPQLEYLRATHTLCLTLRKNSLLCLSLFTTMCLSPVFIINPAYRNMADRFVGIMINDDWRPNHHLYGDIYQPARISPCNVSSNSLSVNHDNISRFYAVTPDGDCVNIYLEVPCGKCLECLNSKQQDIRNRMVVECCMSDIPPIFLTLTYDNEHLPVDGVNKRDIQLFFNRLHLYAKRKFGEAADFRHICFSEYGSKRGRPHYHAIIFGFDYTRLYHGNDYDAFFALEDVFNQAWKNGFTYVKIVDSRAFNYVSKYVGKDLLCGVPAGKNPNFISSTRRNGGIGTNPLSNKEFLEMVLTDEFPRVTIRDRFGHTYTMILPKYIRDKIIPPLSDVIPYRITRALRHIAMDVLALRHFKHEYPNLHRDLIVPDPSSILLEKYWMCPHYFNYRLVNTRHEYYISNLENHDVPGMLYRLYENLEIVMNYYFKEDEFQVILTTRLGYIDKFISSVKKYFESLPQYSPTDRYSQLREKLLKDYSSRCKDSQ